MPTWLLAIVMLVVLMLVIAVAASAPPPRRPAVHITPSATPTITPTPTATPTPPPDLADLRAGIHTIESLYRTSIGLAIAPVAAPDRVTMRPWQGGTLGTGRAWQTIDLPVAYAVATGTNQPHDLAYLLDRAIIDGSPAGDQALWQFLGTPDNAAAQTRAVLAATGDTRTVLPTATASDPAPVFSNVWWTQADAAQFMGVFYCMDTSWPVLYRMTPAGDDGFGLAALPRARVKTGSGTAGDALYQGTSIRQIGLARLNDDTVVGVSLTAEADDGTAATAQRAMSAVAALLPEVTGLPGGC